MADVKAADFESKHPMLEPKRPMFDFYSDMIYDSGEGVESGRCVNFPN